MNLSAEFFGKSVIVVNELDIDHGAVNSRQVHISGVSSAASRVTFDVFKNRIECRESVRNGELCTTYPLSAVSACTTGTISTDYRWLLFLGAILAVVGIILLFTIDWYVIPAVIILCAIMMIILYVLTRNKYIMLGVVNHAGGRTILVMKCGDSGGRKVDYAMVQYVAEIICRNTTDRSAQ